MIKEKIGKVKNIFSNIKTNFENKQRLYLAVGILIFLAIFSSWFLFSNHDKDKEAIKIPSVTIGCDRVGWKEDKLGFKPYIQNINKPKFKWFLNNKLVGNNKTLSFRFNDTGKYNISLRVENNNNKTITDSVSVLIINSTKNIFIKALQDSKNSWKFQGLYNKKEMGVDGIDIYVDSLPKKDVNPCGYASVPLFSGDHNWRAQYHGEEIGKGNFSLKEVTEIKVDKTDIKSSYKVGNIVDGKIVIKNTGTTKIEKFDFKTVATNNNYKWMGDVAKKEYFESYQVQLNPGDKYEITLQIKIPEKVSGIAPTGKYTLAIELLLDNHSIDKDIINTEIKS